LVFFGHGNRFAHDLSQFGKHHLLIFKVSDEVS